MVFAAVGAAAAVASSVNSIVSSSGGGGGGGGGGSSGGPLNITQTQYAYHGPSPSTKPLDGQPPPKPSVLQSPKAGMAKVDTARQTPTQAQGSLYASRDFQGVWADRLSRYLDYNTRGLG